jgi:uncharacterized HAD superfamily protein
MQRSLNIAFDCDGVLFDTENFQITYGSRFFEKKYNMPIVDETAYGIKGLFNCSDSQEVEFWIRHALRYFYMYMPRINTAEVIENLREAGHNIYIVTSKAKIDEKMVGRITKFLLRSALMWHGIKVDGIHYCSVENSAREKTELCRKLNFDIFVEDKLDNILELSKFTRVLCMETRNNQGCEGQNIIRVRSFDNILTEINKLIAEF